MTRVNKLTRVVSKRKGFERETIYRSKTKKQDCEVLGGKDGATYVSAINHENEKMNSRMHLEFCSFFQIFDFFDFG